MDRHVHYATITDHVLIVRLPDRSEYWYSASALELGDTVVYRGTRYEVVGREIAAEEQVVVTLAASNDPMPARPP